MENRTCLFIGGEADGRMMNVAPLSYVYVPVIPILVSMQEAVERHDCLTYQYQTYARHEFWYDHGGNFIFYIIEGMSFKCAMERLIKCYAKENKCE